MLLHAIFTSYDDIWLTCSLARNCVSVRFLEEENGEKAVRAKHVCGIPYKERGPSKQCLKGEVWVMKKPVPKQMAGSSLGLFSGMLGCWGWGILQNIKCLVARYEFRSSRVNLFWWWIIMLKSIFTMEDKVGKNEIFPQNQGFKV